MAQDVLLTDSPDPLVSTDEGVMPASDYAAHVRTFNAVIAGAKWFVLHVLILLVALYSFAIANKPFAGVLMLLCSIALLVYGMLQRGSVRSDLAQGLAAGPRAPESRLREHDTGEDQTA